MRRDTRAQANLSGGSKKITDFFSPSPAPSSSQPSLPPPSQKTPMNALSQIQPLSRPARNIPAPKRPRGRPPKKENAPPAGAMDMPVSRGSKTPVDSRDAIASIPGSSTRALRSSTTSVQPLQSSKKIASNGRPLKVYDLGVPGPSGARRRSPRLQSVSPPVSRVAATTERRVPMPFTTLPPRKRKRYSGIQSSDEDEPIDVDRPEEGIFVSYRPPPPPEPKEAPKGSVGARRKRHKGIEAVKATDEVFVIPSSQSDERELVISQPTTRSPRKSRRNVEEWRQRSPEEPELDFSALELGDDGANVVDLGMDIQRPSTPDSRLTSLSPDTANSSPPARSSPVRSLPVAWDLPPSSPQPNEDVDVGISTSTSMKVPSLQHSPSTSSARADEPQTPRSSPRKGTSRLHPSTPHKERIPALDSIALMKEHAKARAASPASDRLGPLDSLSDSDESDFGTDNVFKSVQNLEFAPKPTGTSHATTSSTTTAPRHSLRISEKKVQDALRPPSPPYSSMLSKKKTINPFAKLEAEKKKHSRFKEANERWLRDLSDDELDETEGSSYDGAGPSSSSPSRVKRKAEAVREIDEGLGLAEPEVTKGLLELDESERKKAGNVLGVPFWSTLEDGVDVAEPEQAMPEFMDQDTMLTTLARKGSFIILMTVLRTRPDISSSSLEWLFDVATRNAGEFSKHAYSALESICARRASKPGSCISFASILSAFMRCGPRSEMMKKVGLGDAPSCGGLPLSTSERLARLIPAIVLLGRLGKARLLEPTDIEFCVALLIAIGMDPSMDFEVKLRVKESIHELITTSFPTLTKGRSGLELDLCSRLLGLAEGLTPVNCVHLLTFLDGDAPMMRRIAQWVAFGMLLGEEGAEIVRANAHDLPPLESILRLLDPSSPKPLNCDHFNLSNDDVDYALLKCHVDILSRVLMNIPQYVALEEKPPKKDALGNAVPTLLMMIEGRLAKLGGSISDAKGNDPNRFHAKSRLQTLAMRISSQRDFALKALLPKRTNLDSFLTRTKVAKSKSSAASTS